VQWSSVSCLSSSKREFDVIVSTFWILCWSHHRVSSLCPFY
jgi:hypothetical protein